MSFVLQILFTSILAGAGPLQDFLGGTTWCFQDKEGTRVGGRLRFGRDGRGTYDVVDAPGRGGIAFRWSTWESWRDRSVMLAFAKGFDPLEQRADVLVLHDEAMLWTWSVESGGTVSQLIACPSRFENPGVERLAGPVHP